MCSVRASVATLTVAYPRVLTCACILPILLGAIGHLEVSHLITALVGAASYLLIYALQAEIPRPLSSKEPKDEGSPHRQWRPGLASASELHSHCQMPEEEEKAQSCRCMRSRCSALRAQTAGQLPTLPTGCTTLVLWHIPKSYTPDMLTARFQDCGYKLDIDFLFLPIDFKKSEQHNVGYAIINFRTMDACRRFTLEFHLASCAEKLPGSKGRNVCEVSAARHQGLNDNIRQLQASSAVASLARRPEWLPRLFDAQGRPYLPSGLRRSSENHRIL